MKSITTVIIITLLFLSGYNLSAQTVTNTSGEVWVINFYGANTTVPASGTPVTLNIDTNCHLGVTATGQMSNCVEDISTPGTYSKASVGNPPPLCFGGQKIRN